MSFNTVEPAPQVLNQTMFDMIVNGSTNYSNLEVYNSEDQLYDVPYWCILLLSLFYGSISLIAVIGNSLVIWIVATTRQMQTVTNLFIANLALADVIIGVFAIPFQFQAALLQRWNLPEFMCGFCPFVQLVSVNVSVLTLTAIAVDRHRAILNPLRARQSKYVSRIIIAFIWMVSMVLAGPILYALRVHIFHEVIKRENDYLVIDRPFCLNANLSEETLKIYRYVLVFMQYAVPFCVISFVYIQMAVKLWGSKTPGNAQNDRDVALLKNKKKVIKMLVIVVVLFGVCWLPLQTYNVLHVTWPSINDYKYINIIWFCCDWLAMSNSCYNPFVYGIYNEKFKREFRKRFPFCRLKGSDHFDYNDTKSMYTRATSIRSNYTNASTRNNNHLIHNHMGHPPHNHLICEMELKSTNMAKNSANLTRNYSPKSQKKTFFQPNSHPNTVIGTTTSKAIGTNNLRDDLCDTPLLLCRTDNNKTTLCDDLLPGSRNCPGIIFEDVDL